MNAIWRVWEDHPPLSFPSAQLTITGYSIAALRTNFYIRELNAMFDAGLSAGLRPTHIFIGHGHSDHMANLPFHLYSDHKVKVFVPAESLEFFDAYVSSMFSLTFNKKTPSPCEFIPVVPGQQMQVVLNNRPFTLDVFKCFHSRCDTTMCEHDAACGGVMPCVGYGFTEMKKKLNPEYVGRTGKELAAMRKAGVELDVMVPRKVFLFLSDTSCEVFKTAAIFEYEIIMLECTFIAEEDYDQATATNHTHWRDLAPHVAAHPDKIFILYHFSQRYKVKEIEEFFVKQAVANIYVWASG